MTGLIDTFGNESAAREVKEKWREKRASDAQKRLPYVAVFSDSANVVNQITRGWNKNERATALYDEAKEALKPFKAWQLSWVPREMNRDADKLSIKPSKASP